MNEVKPLAERNIKGQQRGTNQTNNARKYQQPVSRNVRPINVRGMENQPQRVTSSRKNTVLQYAQPKKNQRKQIIKKQDIN